MRLRWTLPAADDLEQIKKYLDVNYPHLAHSTVRAIQQGVKSLKISPNASRIGLKPGIRELTLHPLPYVIVYRSRNDALEILHIYHGARDRS